MFDEYRREVENQLGRKIKVLRIDRGGEYVSNEFDEYCKHSGIKHQLTMTYTPQQNGVVERCNRTLLEMCRSMMARSLKSS